MNEKTISKEELLRQLRKAGKVRAIITFLSFFLMWLLAAALFGESINTGVFAAFFFGGPLIVMHLLTHFYCKPAVICPYCGSSLWHCGNGCFKTRRMKILDDATGCTECGAVLIDAKEQGL